MRYYALATDYDGTLAAHGSVAQATLEALERLRSSGRKLILVTGRELADLRSVFPELDRFDRVVAENGGLIYNPSTKEEKVLGQPPPPEFIAALRDRGISPLSVGRVLLASWEPHETTIVEVIRDLGLEYHIVFNKGAVMVLPSGLNKATGLSEILNELGLSAHNVVGVGDAENDHAFLSLCECSAAVQNALDSLKKRVDLVLESRQGEGVVQLIDQMIENDLSDVEPVLDRHWISIGTDPSGNKVPLAPYGPSVLLSGTSGSGKSTLATMFLERLAERGYQFCIIDPEGDYHSFAGVTTLGTENRPPLTEEALKILEKPAQSVAVNLVGVPIKDRPAVFETLFMRLQELRVRVGRPHWIVVDEVHHLLPERLDASTLMPKSLPGVMFITVHPEHMSLSAVGSVGRIIVTGKAPDHVINTLHQAFHQAADLNVPPLESGEALLYSMALTSEPVKFKMDLPQTQRYRHRRKYAEGQLSLDRSFFFRGPQNKLNLRAQNLTIFVQIAEGLDDETWLFHLRRRDYSRWFREYIKDDELADQVGEIENDPKLPATESRKRVKAAIEERYTAPA